jgi:hypothetical protein
MRFVLNKHVVYVVLVAFACYVLPVNVFAEEPLALGKKSADEAAKLRSQDATPSDSARSLRYAVPMTGGYAQPDSTEFEFPEEEKKHLARDITVFVIVSVFVAYFLIKVFLEGDKDEGESDDGDNGKKPPPI